MRKRILVLHKIMVFGVRNEQMLEATALKFKLYVLFGFGAIHDGP